MSLQDHFFDKELRRKEQNNKQQHNTYHSCRFRYFFASTKVKSLTISYPTIIVCYIILILVGAVMRDHHCDHNTHILCLSQSPKGRLVSSLLQILLLANGTHKELNVSNYTCGHARVLWLNAPLCLIWFFKDGSMCSAHWTKRDCWIVSLDKTFCPCVTTTF